MIYLSKEELQKLTLMKTITPKDIREIFQNHSSGKIKKPRAGRLWIKYDFLPTFKGSELVTLDGRCVFYAVEKVSLGLFSRKFCRIFIWVPLADYVFTVPVESVCFGRLPKGTECTEGGFNA